jgi:hypothetical protein
MIDEVPDEKRCTVVKTNGKRCRMPLSPYSHGRKMCGLHLQRALKLAGRRP